MVQQVTLSSHGNIYCELQTSAATARAPKGKPPCATVQNCPAQTGAGAGPAPRNTSSTGPTALHLSQGTQRWEKGHSWSFCRRWGDSPKDLDKFQAI